MAVNQTEQEQIEALQKWWADNYKSVIGGLVIGLVAIFGWRGWQSYLLTMAEEASDLYTNMIIEVRDNKHDKAREFAAQLINGYGRTTYADFAALMLARLDVEAGKPDEAAKYLQTVMQDANQNSLQHLARLRLARVLVDQSKIDEALTLLQVKDEGAFKASYAELRGDIYTIQGKHDDARAEYEQVAGNIAGDTSDTSFLQMKIDDLGRRNTE